MGPGNYRNVPARCEISRRRFLQWGALGAVSATVPLRGFAAVRDSLTPERALALHNTHTDEDLGVVYCAKGRYLPGALAEINHILRDHRTGEIKAIDTRLLDLLYVLRANIGHRGPFHVISGYRSPKTNTILRARGQGVAKHSLHLQGKAVDIRLPGCDLSVLRHAAMSLKSGGVGYYPGPNFVHIDVGRVRHW